MTAALEITQQERDTLHWLMSRRLLILGQDPPSLARKERVDLDHLPEEFGEDLRLMEDLGWEVDSGCGSTVLTMPADNLVRTLKRLRRDARRAPCEEPHELEREGADPQRWERFKQAVDACEAVLDRLASPRDEGDYDRGGATCPHDAAADELKHYAPVGDHLILAAIDRAECHDSSEEVWVFVVAEHLGFEPTPKNVAALHPLLEDLRRAGSLARVEVQGRECWSLTADGEEELSKHRETGSIAALPESPQHRAWRHARVEAAVRIEEFRREVAELWEETDHLLSKWDPVRSSKWFDLTERFRAAGWRLGSAVHCLTEWVEPGDEEPDVDEDPGPAPGRRTIVAWDSPHSSEPGGRP